MIDSTQPKPTKACSLAMLLALAASTSAQGTLTTSGTGCPLGGGQPIALDSLDCEVHAGLNLGFAFGSFGSVIDVASQGWVYLVPGTMTGCGGFPGIPFPPHFPDPFTTGTARISVYGGAMQPEVNGDVWFETDGASLACVTWLAVAADAPQSAMDAQIQLRADGSFVTCYREVPRGTLATVGYTPGVGASTSLPNQDLSSGMARGTSAMQPVVEWFSPSTRPFDLDGLCLTWLPNANGSYDVVRGGVFRPIGTVAPMRMGLTGAAFPGYHVEPSFRVPIDATVAALLFGSAPAAIPLDVLGMTACSLYVDASFLALPLSPNHRTASTRFSIDRLTGAGFTVQLQGFALSPSSNPFGVVATDLGTIVVGPAPGEDCTTAPAIGNGVYAGSNRGARTDVVSGLTPGCTCCDTWGADVWYAYTAPCSGIVTVSSCPSRGGSANFNSFLAVYAGACGSLSKIACKSSANSESCEGHGATLAFPAAAGTTYYIAVGGIVPSGSQMAWTGDFKLAIACVPTFAGDDCTTATPIGEGVAIGTNIGATTSPSAWYTYCGSMAADVWYSFSPNRSGVATLSTLGTATDFPALVSVLTGTCGALLTEIACAASKLSVPVTAGTQYFIRVGGDNGATGTFELQVGFDQAVAGGNECAAAAPIAEGIFLGSTAGATTSSPTASCGSVGADVWYAYTASRTGTATLTVTSDSYGADPVLAVFSGTCGALAEIACNDNDFGLPSPSWSRVSIPVVAGTTYYVAVGEYPNSPGDGSFALLVSAR